MPWTQIEMAPFGVQLRPAAGALHVRDLPIPRLRELARQHQLVVLRGYGGFDTADAFAAYCDLWGQVDLWPFGKVLELVEQENPEDHIFASSHMPLHWDGMYRPKVPEFQIFHCVSAPQRGQGGRTTFSHTAMALERATAATLELWRQVTGIYERRMEFYDSRTVAPIVTAHPVKGFPVIRYGEPPREADRDFVNHPEISLQVAAGIEEADIHRTLRAALYAPECFYAHGWQQGDVVIADNYTLLHGREAFTAGAPRHLQRVHILGEPPLENPHLVSYA